MLIFDLVWCVVNAFDHLAQRATAFPKCPGILFVDLIGIPPRELTGRKETRIMHKAAQCGLISLIMPMADLAKCRAT